MCLSTGAVRAKALEFSDVVGHGCGCAEAAPRSLGFNEWGWGMGFASKDEDLESRALCPETQILTSFPGVVRAKVPVVKDVVYSTCGCRFIY